MTIRRRSRGLGQTTPLPSQQNELWWLDPRPVVSTATSFVRHPGLFVYLFASPVGWAYVLGSLAVGYGVYRAKKSKTKAAASVAAVAVAVPYMMQVGRGAWSSYDRHYGRTAQWTQQREQALATAQLATQTAAGFSCPSGSAIGMRRNADGTTDRVCLPPALAA